MALAQTSRYCLHCRRMTLHQKEVFGIGWGCLLTVLTGGIFIPIWILIAIVESSRPHFCCLCRTPEGLTSNRAFSDDRKAAYPPPTSDLPGEVLSDTDKAAYASASAAPSEVAVKSPRVTPPPLPPADDHLLCSTCNAVLPLTAKFCRDCGTPLDLG